MEITLIGYGNQGRAWAANLRDSGWKVRVCARASGNAYKTAQEAGFELLLPEQLVPGDASPITGLIAVLLPDEEISSFFSKYLALDGKPAASVSTAQASRSFLFAHGFSVVYGKLPASPSDDLILCAPKGIGPKLRANYLRGSGEMGVLGVKQDGSGSAWEKAKVVAHALGLDRVGILNSTFEEETYADLLSEQVLLCGAVHRLLDESVRFLVEKGINPKLATFECLHELKLIVDMMVEQGIAGMLDRVSTTATFGGLQAADQLLPEPKLHNDLQKIWAEIQNGSFAAQLSAERAASYVNMKHELEKYRSGPVETHR